MVDNCNVSQGWLMILSRLEGMERKKVTKMKENKSFDERERGRDFYYLYQWFLVFYLNLFWMCVEGTKQEIQCCESFQFLYDSNILLIHFNSTPLKRIAELSGVFSTCVGQCTEFQPTAAHATWRLAPGARDKEAVCQQTDCGWISVQGR